MRQNEALMPGKDKFLAPTDDQYLRFVQNLQKKLQIAFANNAYSALAFFDLSGSEMLRIDEFLFGVEFFTNGNRLKDALMLFQELDVNKDGMLDEQEFEQIMTYQLNKQLVSNCIENSPVGNEMGTEQTLGNYIDGGYNTYNKRPL